MQYKQLPLADYKISTLAIGSWVFGGKGWGGVQEKNCIDTIAAAREYGINFIDTAPIYGNGRSEEIIGKAIRGSRDLWIIATKCGLVRQGKWIVHDLSAKSILKEIEESLTRLNVSYIDLYQCHWPDPNIPIEETLQVLLNLEKAGKIRAFGVCNFDVDLLKKILPLTPFSSLQSQCSLLDRSLEKDIFPLLKKNDIAMLAYGPLAGGILSGKYRTQPQFKSGDVRQFFYKRYSGDSFAKTQRLLERLKKFHRPLNQLALNWVRQQPEVTSVLVGCRTPQQLKENAAAVQWELSTQEFQEIKIILDEHDDH